MLKKTLFFMFVMVMVFGTMATAEQFDGPMPTSFQQSPILDSKTENGELEPVEDRLPEDPYVVDPYERIGIYGGTINVTTTSSAPLGVAFISSSLNGFVEPNPLGNKIVNRFASKVENNEDFTEFTIHLRKGVKWSDGHPFTTEDILFWYNDILQNKELKPSINSRYKANGELMELTALDDYTFKIKYASSVSDFYKSFAKWTQFGRILSPKHYLKDFHPKYTPKDVLDKRVEESGFDAWYELFAARDDRYCEISAVVGQPTLAPYVAVKYNSSRRVYERNPYYWKVDKEGNQLPYIDRVEVEVASDPEVVTGKIISGEIDWNGFLTSTSNYPLYKEYEEKAGYRTMLWPTGKGSEVVYTFNLSSQDEGLREIFQNVDFRRAMSLAINRDEINESLYFGKAEPRQFTVVNSSKFFEPEFATAYAQHDPEKAKNMLESIGLVDRDGDGFRERPDGSKLIITNEFRAGKEGALKLANAELVAEYWKDVGIDVRLKQISSELWTTRRKGNQIDLTLTHGDMTNDMLFPVSNPLIQINLGGTAWQHWTMHRLNDIELEIPIMEEVQNLFDLDNEYASAIDPNEKMKIAKDMLKSQAENIWIIGTVGNAPHPIIVDKDLRNVPEKGFWTWDTQWSMSADPEQFFFDEDADERK